MPLRRILELTLSHSPLMIPTTRKGSAWESNGDGRGLFSLSIPETEERGCPLGRIERREQDDQ
jgi:hypothetical protein